MVRYLTRSRQSGLVVDFLDLFLLERECVSESMIHLRTLQRDSKSLERALQQAGLQTNSESLNFGLRDDQNGQLNPENQDSNENSLEEENSVVESLNGSIKSIPRPFGFSDGAIDLSV